MAVAFASGAQRVIERIKTLCRHAVENNLETQREREARHAMEFFAFR